VAESFSVLSGLLGNRIDLGVGRGMSADATTTFALQRDRRQPAPDDFPDQLDELLAYLDGRPPSDERFASLTPLPGLPGRPEPWLLGSSLQSATWAGRRGLRYAFGDFINPEGAQMARLYREFFTASERLSEPRLAVAVTVICAESDDEAERLAASARMCSAVQRDGTSIAVPPVEKALAYLEQHGWPESQTPRRAVLGTPDTVRAELEHVVREYGAEELIAVTVTHSHDARRRSYELLARAFGLGRRDDSITA
jgi:luciferase family oxidoreductase group 1